MLLLTSKGAAGVTGSGFIVLAATLSAVGHVPVAGLALILGIDRFMSEARALTNLIGNGVATLVVAKWTGDLDTERMQQRARTARPPIEAEEPEAVLDRQPSAPGRVGLVTDRGGSTLTRVTSAFATSTMRSSRRRRIASSSSAAAPAVSSWRRAWATRSASAAAPRSR